MQVDVLCTTAGGIEEDFMKCMMPHYVGDFSLRYVPLHSKCWLQSCCSRNRLGRIELSVILRCARRGQDLRLKGHNRIGNMIVPNDNYCRFEEWFQPLLDEMLAEQVDQVCAKVLFAASWCEGVYAHARPGARLWCHLDY